MDGRALASVALRIWGLLLFLSAAAATPGTILAGRATPWPPEQAEFIRASHTASLFHLGITAVLGLCLLLWADSVARRAIPDTPTLQLNVNVSQLLTVGLVLVGLVTLIRGLEATAELGYVLAGKPQWAETGALSYLWDRQSETMMQALVDTVAGAALVVGRDGIVRAWGEVRSVVRTGRGLTTR